MLKGTSQPDGCSCFLTCLTSVCGGWCGMNPGCYHTVKSSQLPLVSVEHLSLTTTLTMRTEKVNNVLGCQSVASRSRRGSFPSAQHW